MKENHNINKVNSTLYILGLVLLLLLSPCKVRNVIQLELGIPQTTASNKSKTTVSNSNCSSYETGTFTLAKKIAQSLQPPFIIDDTSILAIDFASNFLLSCNVSNHSVSSIPLYILYQNFKDYL